LLIEKRGCGLVLNSSIKNQKSSMIYLRREANQMKRRCIYILLVGVLVGLCASPVFAQATGTVKGTAKDTTGKPMVGATVEWTSIDTGRKYELKTNNKGEYFSLGISPGKYNVKLLQDGKEIFHYNNVPATLDENTLDFDLQKEMANQAKGAGMSAEELKKKQEAAEKASKENLNIKQLNEKLATSRQDMTAGNYDGAIQEMTEATQIDPHRDILWATLGDANRGSAVKQTDPAEKQKRLDAAVDAYQKALTEKQAAAQAGEKDPDMNKKLAAYYNNLADAQGKAGKADDAIKSYGQAATLDPASAGQYYFNLGAVLTNQNKTNDPKLRQDAVDAFDKAIAADPNKADAYYWKGTNLIGAATLKGDKMVAPDGTAESFQKYLELQPTGPHAEEAKAMLTSIGATVETTFGKQKKAPTKKQ
jgi:tetratricopeptide (TPR) repeat protein